MDVSTNHPAVSWSRPVVLCLWTLPEQSDRSVRRRTTEGSDDHVSKHSGLFVLFYAWLHVWRIRLRLGVASRTPQKRTTKPPSAFFSKIHRPGKTVNAGWSGTKKKHNAIWVWFLLDKSCVLHQHPENVCAGNHLIPTHIYLHADVQPINIDDVVYMWVTQAFYSFGNKILFQPSRNREGWGRPSSFVCMLLRSRTGRRKLWWIAN